MGKVVTIHQPNYLPWFGFFSKVKNSDCFVVLDNVEYTKNSVINRSKVRTKEGWCYLTIPIEKKYYSSKICDVKLPKDDKWKGEHWKTIKINYKKSDFFCQHDDFFEKLYKNEFEYLWQINEEIIFYLLKCFDLDIEIIKASELDLDSKLRKTDLLVAILNSVATETYLSGPTGRNYLEFDKFKENGIKLEFFEFEHPIYKQRYSGFEPYMAAIDLLFNIGEKSTKFL